MNLHWAFISITNMKNLILLILAFTTFSVAAQDEKKIDSKITAVTVFLNKAQVTRKASSTIESGKSNIIITGLTSQLDQQSIQVAGKGAFIIHGISHRQNYLNEHNIPKALKALKDSVENLQRLLAFENSQLEILNREEQMILSNQKIGGANQNLTAAELKAMADFYRTRLTDIITTRMKIDQRIRKVNESVFKIQRQIDEQNQLYARNTSEIVVTLSAENQTSIDLEVTYVVNNAGWTPVYDLRALNTKSPVQLNYKANVYQNTGEEWKNVRLKLSTANPSLGGLKPELYTWYLNFYQEQYSEYKRSRAQAGAVNRASAPEADMQMSEKEEAMPAETVANYVRTIETTLNTEFDITLPYTVTSGTKPTLVDVKVQEVKAEYQYSVAPKLDKDAFLIANAVGWEEFNLLPGEANIFFEGTFVGKSFIDPNSIKDTLAISLGRDKRIVVKREKLKDFSSKKMIGTNQRALYAFEISVRNTKNEVVKIKVEDQIPVSQNSQIEIAAEDVGGAKYNSATGKLVWDITLQPNETKKLVYKYEVKFPKDKVVAGLE
jgi:uncharacterized protein (TIGR02231 family)